jgi:hypothetical protein
LEDLHAVREFWKSTVTFSGQNDTGHYLGSGIQNLYEDFEIIFRIPEFIPANIHSRWPKIIPTSIYFPLYLFIIIYLFIYLFICLLILFNLLLLIYLFFILIVFIYLFIYIYLFFLFLFYFTFYVLLFLFLFLTFCR